MERRQTYEDWINEIADYNKKPIVFYPVIFLEAADINPNLYPN